MVKSTVRFEAHFCTIPATRSAAVPAASCGGVSPPARTPGGTPGELAGEDACATFTGKRRKRRAPVQEPTHPRPLPGGESGRALAVPLPGGERESGRATAV